MPRASALCFEIDLVGLRKLRPGAADHRFKDQREELVRGYSEESLELRQAMATEAGDGYPVTVDTVLSDRPEASVRLLRRLCDSPGECASDSTFLKDHSTVNYTMCARTASLHGLVRHPQWAYGRVDSELVLIN